MSNYPTRTLELYHRHSREFLHNLTQAYATTPTKSRGGLSTHGANKAKLHADYGAPWDRTENLLITS